MTAESWVSEDSWGLKSCNIIRLSSATEELEENEKDPLLFFAILFVLDFVLVFIFVSHENQSWTGRQKCWNR